LPAAGGSREISPDGCEQLTAEMVDAIAELYAYPPAAATRPWVRANMVASADGAAWLRGRAGGLSGPAGRAGFAGRRGVADALLVGAGTARIERYKPVKTSEVHPQLRVGRTPTPQIAVVSRALDLDLESPLLAGIDGRARTIVLTTPAAGASRREAA